MPAPMPGLTAETSHSIGCDDLWSLINLGDETISNSPWPQQEVCLPNGIADTSATSSSSPCSDAYGESGIDGPLGSTAETGQEAASVGPSATATEKRAKRQAQNRVAQQAFRARKEKLVRGLSSELASLQTMYTTTKAENEQLHTDLRLAQTELSAIRSVLQHTQISPVPGSGPLTPLTSGSGTQYCSVSADPSACTLTLKVNIDGLLMERSRQCSLLTPPLSDDGEDGINVDLGMLSETLQYQ